MLPALAPARFLWLPKSMQDATEKMQPQKRGRPAIGKGTPVQVRLQPDLLEWVDAQRAKLEHPTTRPEFIRILLEEKMVQGS